ncbi:gamma-taxilin [Ostrinia furnacalis]|uniref:gamma-taxilin n=1 Tax=Ostrinia furnacalis TaxID=93504 RepID=UPI00103EC863|nr:gamma-taxilin [Ostrinia furnacalis]
MEAAVKENPNESAVKAAPEAAANEEPPAPPPQDPPKKSKKEDRVKKDDKNVEQFMKSLNSVPSYEEKFATVCKKYVQTADENKKLQFYIKQSDKRYALLLKEKEQLQHEFNKTILVKSKLENLCRELQKQNKAIKEESLLKIREEEERRKETQAKFQNTLMEITTLLNQNNEKNAKLRDDNISMSEKFKSVVQQYQLREQQVDKMAKQMALESQLSDAKMQKASLEHQAERERIVAEMEQLKVSVAQYRAKILELQGTETALRGQLAVYTDKYDEFQNALVKSNQVFGGFKEQMEKMSKKIKKLEKESLSWKSRWETSQTALLDMCGERQASEEKVANTARQLHHMQSLCRTLQAERTLLLGTLKENNIERPPLPPISPVPVPVAVPSNAALPNNNAKVDAMAANCVQLRQSLAHLQSQLNSLTKKNETKEESPKPEKAKKSKAKKNKAKAGEKSTEKEETNGGQEQEEEKPVEKVEKKQNKAQKVEKQAQNEEKETKEDSKESPKEEASATEVAKEIETTTNGDNAQLDIGDEKVDDKTLESLIQAINNANINLCDLEVGDDENDLDSAIVDSMLAVEMNENNESTANTNGDNKPAETKTNEVVEPKVSEVTADKLTVEAKEKQVPKEKTNAVEPKQNKVPEGKVNVVSNTEVKQILNEANSNDEVSHIPEVKPISVETA